MTAVDALLLVLAGVGAGLSGSIAGLASIVSYPALLAVGLGPVSANVTNTVALVFGAVGAVLGSRPELQDQGRRLRRLGPVGVLGGATGAVLLLVTPAGDFERIVPWLIALASAAMVVQPKVAVEAGHVDPTKLAIPVFFIAVYGGYFGAAAGVLLLATLLLTTQESLPRANAVKNVVLGLANVVAAVIFVSFGPVDWAAVGPLAAGFLVGGRLGPIVVRRVPARLLRLVIAAAGIGLAVHLGLDAYR